MEMLVLLLLGGLAIGLGGLGGGGGDSDDDDGGAASEGPPATQMGDSGDNELIGLPELDDAIYGRAGGDTITGDVGNDYLDGGLGDDVIDGGIGNDTISGALGSDSLDGGPGEDLILGYGGADTINGGEGDDSIRGGDGPDSITGDEGSDTMEGGLGQDTISGILADPEDFPDDAGDDNAADQLEGWGGADRIILGSGDHAYGEFETTEADGAGDTFVVGTWIAGPPATVHDFDPDVDEIELYNVLEDPWDVVEDSDADGVVWVLELDDVPVLRLPVGLSGDVVTVAHVTERTPTV